MISTYKLFIFIITEVLFYFSIHFYFSSILNRYFFLKRTLISYLICIVIGIFTYYIQIPSELNMIISIIIFLFLCTNYSKNKIKCILYSVLLEFFIAFFELATTYSVSFLFSVSVTDTLKNDITYTISMILCRFIMLICSYILYAKRTKINIADMATHFWPVITIFSICSLYIFYYLLSLSIRGKINSYSDIAFVLVIVVFYNLTIYYLYDKQCKEKIVNDKNSELVKYIEVHQAKQEETYAYYKKINEFRHDLKNLFLGMSILMKKNDYIEVNNILKEKTEEFSTTKELTQCPDSVLEAITDCKREYAQKNNIKFYTSIQLDSATKIRYDDLSILLGNLLDNAIEYQKSNNLENKYVDFSVSYDYGIVKMKISNPVSKKINIPSNFIIPSTKREFGHGYGLTSVKKIVDKYSGMLLIECSNTLFTVQVSLIPEEINL